MGTPVSDLFAVSGAVPYLGGEGGSRKTSQAVAGTISRPIILCPTDLAHTYWGQPNSPTTPESIQYGKRN